MNTSLSNALESTVTQSTQIGLTNRRNAYHEVFPDMAKQDAKIFSYVYAGINDAHSIAKETGMLLTSVRRSLSFMRSRGFLNESGSVLGIYGKLVTTYAVNPNYINPNISPQSIQQIIDSQ